MPLRWTDRRRKAWAARCRDAGWLDSLPAALDAIEASPFCRGDNDRGWEADVDWLLRPDTVTRLLEGRYRAGCHAGAAPRRGRGDRASDDLARLGGRPRAADGGIGELIESLRYLASHPPTQPSAASYEVVRAATLRLETDYAGHRRAVELRGAVTAAEVALDSAAAREAATC